MTDERPTGPFGPYVPTDDADVASRILGIRPEDRVLEVGGAANSFARADVVCDLTFGETNQRNGAAGVFSSGTSYVEARAESLPFADGEFDFVWCTQVLEHVADPVKAAAELSRVARRGFVETPSRAGELFNGNPSHRWLVDREGDALVFTPRTFVEHPFDHLFYGALFRDAELRRRAEHELRGELNHQLSFEGKLQVRVAPPPAGVAVFDYDDPSQAARAHYHFARCCLAAGADLTYALVDAEIAASLLPQASEPRRLLAVYRARLLRFDGALDALEGLEDDPTTALRRLILRAKEGAPEDLRALPSPGPLTSATAALPRDPSPLVSFAVPAETLEGLRDAVESALTQDYPAVEVVVAAADPAGARAALRPFEGVERLRYADASGLAGGSLFNAAFGALRGGIFACVLPGERLYASHAARLVADLLASGSDASHGDALRLADGSVSAPDLVPGNPATAAFTISSLVAHQAAFLRTGPFPPEGPRLWLAEFAAKNRVRHVPLVTLASARATPAGEASIRAAAAELRLDPIDLVRDALTLHAKLAASERRVAELSALLERRP